MTKRRNTSLSLAAASAILLTAAASEAALNPDDIRNFGAVCNSTTSQAANNSAISSALSTNGAAFIPNCSIYISNVTVPNGTKIYGLGASSKLVAYGSVLATGLLNCSSCSSGFDVDRVSITVSSSQRATGVSGISCTDGCGSVHITNNVVQGNYGILLTNASGAFVDSNRITAYGDHAGMNIAGAGIAVQGTTLDTYGYNCGGTSGTSVTVANNTISGAATSGTPAGILFCNHDSGAVVGNTLSLPGYFGIAARGPNVSRLLIDRNRISSSKYEGIHVASGAGLVQVIRNTLLFDATSIGVGITVDGNQGTVTQVNISSNQIRDCYQSCVVLAGGAIQFSTVLNNSIVNANNSNGGGGQSGIRVSGAQAQFNTISGNSITNTGVRAGYLILETNDGFGMPSHNVYANNSGFNMWTGTFSVTGTGSISNNNIEFQ